MPGYLFDQNFIQTATTYVLYYVETVLIAYFIRIWQLKRYIVWVTFKEEKKWTWPWKKQFKIKYEKVETLMNLAHFME